MPKCVPVCSISLDYSNVSNFKCAQDEPILSMLIIVPSDCEEPNCIDLYSGHISCKTGQIAFGKSQTTT